MALPETIRKAERDKLYTRRFGIKLNTNTDADILEHLAGQPNIQGYIKKALRAYIASEKEGGERIN